MSTRIPEISNERLKELVKRIRPVVRYAKGEKGLFESGEGIPYYIKPVHPRNVSYLWNAKPVKMAAGLATLTDITTYHTYGYHGFFKPSIAEVIAQIPEKHIDRIMAFEIIESPETADDLNLHLQELNEGYHVAVTRLYRKKHAGKRPPKK